MKALNVWKIFMAILLVLTECIFAEEVPPEVKNTITEALKGKWVFEYQIFEKNKIQWGFDSTTKLSDIHAGEPFPVYNISQDCFTKANWKTPLCSLLTSDESWLVPLFFNGKLMPSVLWVAARFGCGYGDKWAAVIRSENNLIHEWENIKNVWTEKLGYHPKFVLVKMDLLNVACFFIPEKGDFNLTILGNFGPFSLPVTVDTTFAKLAPSYETIRTLRTIWCDGHKGNVTSLPPQINPGSAGPH